MSNKRSMAVILILSLAALPAVSGCMGHQPNPVQAYQYGDDNKSCSFLRGEISECESGITQKYQIVKSKQGQNVALGVTGAVLFWPALFFMDLKGADKVEMEALEKRRQTLYRFAVDKKCEWCAGQEAPSNYLETIVKADAEKAAKEEKFDHDTR